MTCTHAGALDVHSDGRHTCEDCGAPVTFTEEFSSAAEAIAGKRMIGPFLPIAFCRSCSTRLTFTPMVWRPRYSPPSTGWRCHCEGCVDGEYVGDPPTLQMSVRSGEGGSPWEALDDCAAMQWDCEPEELLQPKEEP